MILFSQMNQDIGWFVKYMIDKNMLGSVKELVLAIIAARPGGERARLKKIVAENIAAEEERMRIKE